MIHINIFYISRIILPSYMAWKPVQSLENIGQGKEEMTYDAN